MGSGKETRMLDLKIRGWEEACFINHDGGVVTACTAPLSVRVVGKKLNELMGRLSDLGWTVHSGSVYVTFLVRGRKNRVHVDKGDSL